MSKGPRVKEVITRISNELFAYVSILANRALTDIEEQQILSYMSQYRKERTDLTLENQRRQIGELQIVVDRLNSKKNKK